MSIRGRGQHRRRDPQEHGIRAPTLAHTKVAGDEGLGRDPRAEIRMEEFGRGERIRTSDLVVPNQISTPVEICRNGWMFDASG